MCASSLELASLGKPADRSGRRKMPEFLVKTEPTADSLFGKKEPFTGRAQLTARCAVRTMSMAIMATP
jgi:hypothetical protein